MKKLLGINTGKHTIASSLSINYGEKLDSDFEYLLGADSGLRGYKDRTFFGDQRLILNLEDRIHIVEDVLKLFDLGAVLFADAGGASRSGLGDILTDKLYYDVGIGLRIGLPRSSGGAVIRVDLAFPLRDGPEGSNTLEPRLLITSGQMFGGGLRSESYKAGVPQVSSGFLP